MPTMTETELELESEIEVETETVTCYFCSGEFDPEDITHFDGRDCCEDCLTDETYTCDRCGERVWHNNAVTDENIALCDSCYTNYYNTCNNCNRIIHTDESFYPEDDNDEPLCCRCYEEHESSEKSIRNYGYKPSPIFFGDQSNLHLGVELELDVGGESNDNACSLLDIANESDEHIYIKHDGSLDNGFEIVTHPMTLEYHQENMTWSSILTKAISMGYRSHQSGTCGLHVHVSRCALGTKEEEQEETIARVLFFIEKHWNEMLLFSRRTELQINKWAARYGYKDSPKEILETAKNHDLGRYACINLQNYSTIEFRIFRGSLKYQTLIATLQMVNEICNVAISISDEAFKGMTWQQFVANINPEIKPQLINYLKVRRLYVNEPVIEESEDL